MIPNGTALLSWVPQPSGLGSVGFGVKVLEFGVFGAQTSMSSSYASLLILKWCGLSNCFDCLLHSMKYLQDA